jgi:hypothetical protein
MSTTPWRRIGGEEIWLHAFKTSALDGDEWSASSPGCFTPREKIPGTHWIGNWVGPRAVLDAMVKRKIPSPRRESPGSRNPDRPARGLVAIPTGLSRLYIRPETLRTANIPAEIIWGWMWNRGYHSRSAPEQISAGKVYNVTLKCIHTRTFLHNFTSSNFWVRIGLKKNSDDVISNHENKTA